MVPLLLVCFRVFIYKLSPFSLSGPVSFYLKVNGIASPSGDIPACYKAGDLPFRWPLPSPSMVVSPDLAKIKKLRFFDPMFFRSYMYVTSFLSCKHSLKKSGRA